MGNYYAKDGRLRHFRYEVHVYRFTEGAQTYLFDRKELAIGKAKEFFDLDEVYKVKVWDLQQGFPVPNLENAPGLIAVFH